MLNWIIYERTEDYEVNCLSRRLINFVFWHPLLSRLPKWMRVPIGHSSPESARMVFEAMSFDALEAMYTFNPDNCSSFWGKVWENLTTVKATRNRLKLVKRLVKEALCGLFDRQTEIRLASIASGSARAIIEVIAELPDDFPPLRVQFCDVSRSALDYSRKLYCQLLYGSNPLGEWKRVNVTAPVKIFSSGLHVVEMVGLLDYFNRDGALDLLTRIYESLEVGGYLVVGNIRENPESRFIEEVIGWRVINREPEEFESILIESGFRRESIRIYLEPLLVHGVAVCKK